MQWIWGIGVGVIYTIAAARVLGTAYGVGLAIQEGNDIIRDVTSTKPSMNPTSLFGRVIRQSSEIEMNRGMRNRNLPRFQM